MQKNPFDKFFSASTEDELVQQFTNLAKHLEVFVNYVSEKFQPLYVGHLSISFSDVKLIRIRVRIQPG